MLLTAIVAVCILVLVLFYGALIASEARAQVEKAPKDEMFVCDIHGPIQKSKLVNINKGSAMMPGDLEWEYDGQTTTGTVPYCPICFQDRVVEARKRFK